VSSSNLELVDKVCYLGDMLSVDGDADVAVEARIRIDGTLCTVSKGPTTLCPANKGPFTLHPVNKGSFTLCLVSKGPFTLRSVNEGPSTLQIGMSALIRVYRHAV